MLCDEVTSYLTLCKCNLKFEHSYHFLGGKAMNHTKEQSQIKVVDWIFRSLLLMTSLFHSLYLKLASAQAYIHLKTVSEWMANALTEQPASTRWHGRTLSKNFVN